MSAQRETLTRLVADHRIGDAAFHVVEAEIALLELTADTRARPAGEPGYRRPSGRSTFAA